MVFVVSETGVNWDGDPKLAESMIRGSKKAGCDAVKFQAFRQEHVAAHPQGARLLRAAVTASNAGEMKSMADSAGIEFFCTSFYPEAVKWLNPLVKRFKIRELDSRPILQGKRSALVEAVLDTGKEVIISSAEKPADEVLAGRTNIRWLYCVPKYPAALEEIDFAKMRDFDGYSNHCPETIAPITAAILGASIVEVHVTQDKSKDYIDNNVSFDFRELEYLVGQIRLVERMKIR